MPEIAREIKGKRKKKEETILAEQTTLKSITKALFIRDLRFTWELRVCLYRIERVKVDSRGDNYPQTIHKPATDVPRLSLCY